VIRGGRVKKDGGPNLYRERKRDYSALQPTKCRGCVEGKWEGSVQFCGSPRGCVRGEGNEIRPTNT
jgi:hypothetical protein